MEKKVSDILDELATRYPPLSAVKGDIEKAYFIIKDSYDAGGKLLIAGNGGSASDSAHIVGELMKSFVKKRALPEEMKQKLIAAGGATGEKLSEVLQGALPAIALTDATALNTAFLNDVDGVYAYAQQVYGYGREGDVFLGISTSGNSRNVAAAAVTARALGMKVIALTGGTGGKIKDLADCAVIAPSSETFKIQEYHLPIYHALCLMLEATYFE